MEGTIVIQGGYDNLLFSEYNMGKVVQTLKCLLNVTMACPEAFQPSIRNLIRGH